MSEGTSEPRVLPRPEHPISRKDISPNALKVLYRLHQRGHKAYLVGGSVRDLMLGRRPKDFDVSTDASPQEVRRLFRNSRIIGRRFRLVHVVFEGEVIEVSTFRGAPEAAEVGGGPPAPEEELLVTSDNTFGTPREDAFRRDFTVNALFYDIEDFSVIDWVGGIEDLQRRVIRVIGDPDLRFQEDPVRMMRACEYAGRLAFGIDAATQESIHRQRQKVELASPVRVTEEILQLLRCGHAGAAVQWMLELGLLEVLLPEAYAMVGGGAAGVGDFGRLLPTVDRQVARLREQQRELSDATLLAVLLLPKVLQRRDDIEAIDQRPMSRSALRQLVDETVAPFAARLALSRARASQLNHALVAFHRLCEPGWTPRARVQMARRAYFEDGLALFELMVEATGEGREALAAWQAAATQRGRLDESAKPPSPGASAAAGGLVVGAKGEGGGGEAPLARRRRRRRRRRRGSDAARGAG
ncbi:MAG TPA: polynucleotide adenylyltransferase PcnB [Thermoanaerobaculia bacterium]|nr:polynucleotide adenylyltransferase PcnB [Thermoanaerobaculia bacterium]